jgi:hypothetical protein
MHLIKILTFWRKPEYPQRTIDPGQATTKNPIEKSFKNVKSIPLTHIYIIAHIPVFV